jgi:sialic acid synthase SpsE
MKPIPLDTGRVIGPDEPCFLVAEIGQNHQGDVYTALRLATEANRADVDAVKLCKRHLPSEMTAAMASAPYDNPHSFGRTYGEHREKLELGIDEYRHLQARMQYNRYQQILFSTVCDVWSAAEVEQHLNPPLYKIASRDLDNEPLIECVARFGKPIVLSTGMVRGNEQDIENALTTIRRHHDRIVLLYCVSEYPTPDHHVRLPRSAELRERYGVLVGFSDHTVGIHLAQAAVQAGAVMIEKHITLSRAMPGTDHAGSLEPQGLQRFVRNIRGVEKALDSAEPQGIDVSAARKKLGRSLVSRCEIPAGAIIESGMVCLKSPGDGVHWPERDKIIGHRATVHIPEDVTLQLSDVAEHAETD